MTRKQAKGCSRWLSRHLRHESNALTPDAEGWVPLTDVFAAAPWMTQEMLEQVVRDNDKQRFTIDGDRIRANQGHSIQVNLSLEPVEPPEFLYHGTFPKVVATIEAEGLSKMARHHVHMAAETGTAMTVGRRSGTPVVFKVLAGQMHRDGFVFYCSANGVWLVEHAPPKYLEKLR